MKTFRSSWLLAICFALSAVAVTPFKSFLVTFPSNTPDSVVQQAKDLLEKGGVIITHEYQFIKGFAVQGTLKVLETIHTLGTEFPPVIEEDSIVSIDGKLVPGGEQVKEAH